MGYMAPARGYRPLVDDDQGGHFLLPRFEFATDIELTDGEPSARRVEQDINALLSWMAANGMELDLGHTQNAFDTGRERGLPILVPDVIVAPHEAATFARGILGEEFAEALRSLVTELRRRQAARSSS
jgi:hypothetical protein